MGVEAVGDSAVGRADLRAVEGPLEIEGIAVVEEALQDPREAEDVVVLDNNRYNGVSVGDLF